MCKCVWRMGLQGTEILLSKTLFPKFQALQPHIFGHFYYVEMQYSIISKAHQPLDDGNAIPGTPLQLLQSVAAVGVHGAEGTEELGEVSCAGERVVVGNVLRRGSKRQGRWNLCY